MIILQSQKRNPPFKGRVGQGILSQEGLLYYFITKWCDSWAIIETDLFLNFIESKGYNNHIILNQSKKVSCLVFLKKMQSTQSTQLAHYMYRPPPHGLLPRIHETRIP
jgi:hypothetical protein